MQKITPFLWFDGKAEEAMNFYVSLFKNSRIVSVKQYGEDGPGPKGTVITGTFQLEGQSACTTRWRNHLPLPVYPQRELDLPGRADSLPLESPHSGQVCGGQTIVFDVCQAPILCRSMRDACSEHNVATRVRRIESIVKQSL